jgi:glycosyltransferase involved in cell wall biosynthesis
LSKEDSDKCVLLLHTTPIDNNGTDLYAVKDKVCSDYNVVFSTNKIESDKLNELYNIADCTVNIASNEGFGLGTAESIMAGTPIIVNITGGLQDQCGFDYTADDYIDVETLSNKNKHNDTPHGVWVNPIWPAATNINGSPITPYIFDDRVNDEEVADKIMSLYMTDKELRKRNGLKGREFAIKNLSSKVMCEAMSEGIETTIKNFTPRERFNLYKIV